jgi:hypothetical protein
MLTSQHRAVDVTRFELDFPIPTMRTDRYSFEVDSWHTTEIYSTNSHDIIRALERFAAIELHHRLAAGIGPKPYNPFTLPPFAEDFDTPLVQPLLPLKHWKAPARTLED